MSYDTLIVAAGAKHSYFGLEEFGVARRGSKRDDRRYRRSV
jgi:NADH dehydrogenase FAD-containing subunit